MSIMLHLSTLALKGAAQTAGDVVGLGVAGLAAEQVAGFLLNRFVDQSQRLNRALARASDRAWRAVEVALAGNSWWDRCKVALSGADERGFREQIQAFLKANPLDGVDGHGVNFRSKCLAQLQAARKASLLEPAPPPPDRLARRVGSLARFGDPTSRVKAEYKVVVMIADELRKHGYDALATFLELRPASGPPVLASAVHYFFQREVEEDRELFQGLAYAQLESLAQGQSTGFASLADALDRQGERLEALLADVQEVVVQTHADVLDVKAELQRQGQQMHEFGDAVLRALEQHQLEKRTLHCTDSLSIRGEDERQLVKDLVRRYRSLPAEKRQQMPALLNAVGKLQVVAGEFEAAENDFLELAGMVSESSACAEAAHNAYLAALERRAWDDALVELKSAARHDPGRFAPFPMDKFEPERILGAGGFGVAFLCRNTRSGGQVVIKTLLREGLNRDVNEVFREAQALEKLEHSAIVRIRDCDFAGDQDSRPYLVMDYFPGQTLAEHVNRKGPLKVKEALPLAWLLAEGLSCAHESGILHRDVKPANILVRLSQERWEVRLIDFGLAMRSAGTASTRRSARERTLAGASIAGTLEYAAPEQLGKLEGVAVGPHSDVYGFARTCCFALFGTAQPTFQHWQQIPRDLADLLGRCLAEHPRDRLTNFGAFLRSLDKVILSSSAPPQRPMKVEVPPREPPRRTTRDVEPRRSQCPDLDSPRTSTLNPIYIGVALFGGVVVLGLAFLLLASHASRRGADLPPANKTASGTTKASDTTTKTATTQGSATFGGTVENKEVTGGTGSNLGGLQGGLGSAGGNKRIRPGRGVNKGLGDSAGLGGSKSPGKSGKGGGSPADGLEFTGNVHDFVRTAIEENRIIDVDIRGFMTGKTDKDKYRVVHQHGGVLVGLEVSLGRFINNVVVKAWRPIFLTKDGEIYGRWLGSIHAPPGIVKAKEGYVVSGMSIRTGLGVDGFTMTFARLGKNGLDLGDTYNSPPIGGMGGNLSTIGGKGALYIGVAGYLSSDLSPCALGFVAALPKQ
jgi:serine/threonine protein kinase